MRSVSSKCIILGHKNFLENDKQIFIYSEDFGKLKIKAKGSRKLTSKFTGHLETFNIATVSLYFGPRSIILTEIETIKNFKNITKNLDSLTTALKIAEITNKFTYENQIIPGLIQLIEECLNSLDKNELIFTAFVIKFLDKLGEIPDFKEIESKLDLKFLKFFQFIKTRSIKEITKIKLSSKEEKTIKDVIKKLLEQLDS